MVCGKGGRKSAVIMLTDLPWGCPRIFASPTISLNHRSVVKCYSRITLKSQEKMELSEVFGGEILRYPTPDTRHLRPRPVASAFLGSANLSITRRVEGLCKTGRNAGRSTATAAHLLTVPEDRGAGSVID